ncbi:MAG TPA: DUF4230 domain-containing protein [Blastocatellia bacterium]|nr:DUF4230 domain-containing protein [Blastocatellia bacterium]
MNEKLKVSPKHVWILLTAIVLLWLVAMVLLWRTPRIPALVNNQTNITHSLVVEKVQSVGKLVTSETTLRDVVVFEDTWYGSTKRSLVVVTGKLLAGINLERGTDVKIDDAAKKITISLPSASIMAVDIMEMKTYDEQRGLWNSFQPADRDKIFQQARAQIEEAGKQNKLLEHANQSAKQLLETMFTRDGYTAEVSFYEQLP